MNFFERIGQVAIGSRLRMLTDRITADASLIYQMYGVEIKPKWFPVFCVLSEGKARTITAIAKEIGHTHPSVSNMVKEMAAQGLIEETADDNDRRKNVIMLSDKGLKTADMLAEQCDDVTRAIETIANDTRNNLWEAIGEWEALLTTKTLYQRVKEVKRAREKQQIEIIPYESCFQPLFKSLNEAWITAHWQLEKHDMQVLDDPQQQIIDKGGHIFVATFRNEPVGVCALCKMEQDSPYDYELAKLAVSSQAQGKGIGMQLCEAVINQARALGAKKLFLESNTRLEPAIHLYRKIGFRALSKYHPTYARGNIQMELTIE